MANPLPRILSAVPQTLHVQAEIAKAIQMLTGSEPECRQPSIKAPSSDFHSELIKECACELRDEFLALVRSRLGNGRSFVIKAAVDDPKHPGWPARTPDGKGGEFRPKNELVAAADGPEIEASGIGHNQGPPLEEPPKIPKKRPATKVALNIFIKAAAFWLAAAAETAAFKFRQSLNAVKWLRDCLQSINTYSDPPKTIEELQQDAQNPQPGYNIHHIVEQTPARQDEFPESMINGPENLVRIPTLKHWQISAWYQTQNPEFKDPNNPDSDGMSPRDYLRGKNWDERKRVGLDTLIKFGVLKP